MLLNTLSTYCSSYKIHQLFIDIIMANQQVVFESHAPHHTIELTAFTVTGNQYLLMASLHKYDKIIAPAVCRWTARHCKRQYSSNAIILRTCRCHWNPTKKVHQLVSNDMQVSQGDNQHLSELAGQTSQIVRRITLLIRTIQQDQFIPKWYARQ